MRGLSSAKRTSILRPCLHVRPVRRRGSFDNPLDNVKNRLKEVQVKLTILTDYLHRHVLKRITNSKRGEGRGKFKVACKPGILHSEESFTTIKRSDRAAEGDSAGDRLHGYLLDLTCSWILCTIELKGRNSARRDLSG